MADIAVQERKDNLSSIWDLFDGMVTKSNLDLIPMMSVVTTDQNVYDDNFKNALDKVRVDRITKIVYDKKENNLIKFNSLFSAISASSSAVFVMLHNNGIQTEIYLGISAAENESASDAMATLEGALQGNFPGILTKDVDAEALIDLSEKLRNGNCISCVTGVPSKKNDNDIPFSQGLEKIIEALGNNPYTALFLATPVSTQQISEAEQAYNDIYSQLSLLNLNQMSLSQQQSLALAQSMGKSFSTALSTNISKTNTTTHTDSFSRTNTKTLTNSKAIALSKSTTENDTHTNGNSQAHTEGASNAHTDGVSDAHTDGTSKSHTTNWGSVGKTGGMAGGAAAGAALGLCLGGPIGAAIGGVGGGIGGRIVGGEIGNLAGTSTKSESQSDTHTVNQSDTITTNQADTLTTSTSDAHATGITEGETNTETNSASEANGITEGEAEAKSEATQEGSGKTETNQQSQQDSITHTELQGISFNYAIVEKKVVESQKIIDEQLVRLRQAKNYGGWNWAAYFIGNTNNVTKLGANVLAGILRGEQSGIEHSAIFHWDNQDSEYFKAIQDELAKFRHPVFEDKNGNRYSPTSLLTTPELTVGMSLPQKSLPALPVFSSAEFGRAVIHMTNDSVPKRLYHLGHIVHLDKEYKNNSVDLNLDSLTSHTFITGSTGVGKSNAIYGILKKLRSERIPFLVIEPAKGEYKEVFGGLNGVSVLGTNPYCTELLRINPFSFPEEIHIIEHIDRLIEILNAAWPMYSAMPAILKKAVERTYERCGWNLLTSRNVHNPSVFPDFTDLMDILPSIIDSTDYSAEVTGNYKGALLERVGSLTNGYYRNIFQKDELPLESLFDESVIVDLSRVSSLETKSLLMGILFQKLQEYRIAKTSSVNSELKHITVLEEAHHLLRKTTTEQGTESANLTGKSIEMLTNAIAEMRTYGEGFIIADQAPDLLDPAVIRNTNTKIVFNLPDFADRDLVGKAQGLTDEQIEELAHLRRGYASVFQNNWQEAVICLVDKFDSSNMTNMGTAPKYSYNAPKPEQLKIDCRTQTEMDIIRLLLEGLSGKHNNVNSELQQKIHQYMPNITAIFDNGKANDYLYCLNEILIKNKINQTSLSPDINVWIRRLLTSVVGDSRVIGLSDNLLEELVKSTFTILYLYEKNNEQKSEWKKAIENTGAWRIWK